MVFVYSLSCSPHIQFEKNVVFFFFWKVQLRIQLCTAEYPFYAALCSKVFELSVFLVDCK